MATASPGGGYNQVDLLLIGKTGHGKSSTGNAILGKRAFQVSDNAESETNDVQVECSQRLGRTLRVIDTPGLFDSRMEKGQSLQKAIRDMEKCVWECPNGIHAILLVLKYGNRFTDEELQTIKNLKSMFGESFVRDYCIVIFTHGEIFDLNNQDELKRSFSTWCREQRGALRNILAECNYKAVLFYNKRKEKSDAQLRELLSLVDRKRGVRYTNAMFKKAAAERERMAIRANAPKLRQEVQSQLNVLDNGLERLRFVETLDDRTQERIDTLKRDCKRLLNTIAEKDKGSGVLDALKGRTERLLQSIESREEALKARADREENHVHFLHRQIGLWQHFEILSGSHHVEIRRQVTLQRSPSPLSVSVGEPLNFARVFGLSLLGLSLLSIFDSDDDDDDDSD